MNMRRRGKGNALVVLAAAGALGGVACSSRAVDDFVVASVAFFVPTCFFAMMYSSFQALVQVEGRGAAAETSDGDEPFGAGQLFASSNRRTATFADVAEMHLLRAMG